MIEYFQSSNWCIGKCFVFVEMLKKWNASFLDAGDAGGKVIRQHLEDLQELIILDLDSQY